MESTNAKQKMQSTKAKYFLVKTDYTDRLSKFFDFIPYKYKNNEWKKTPKSDEYCIKGKYKEETGDPYPLFIVGDSRNLIYLPKNLNKKYYKDIQKIMEFREAGIVVFEKKQVKNKNNFLDYLEELNYCAWFKIDCMDYLIDEKTNKVFAIEYYIDTESG